MLMFSSWSAFADINRQKAMDVHKRIASVPPTPAVLDQMAAAIAAKSGKEGLEDAARIAILNQNFYNVTLKSFAKKLTNVNESSRVRLNDMTATIIGAVRDSDEKPFGRVLHEDVIYTAPGAIPAYSATSNAHYESLEDSNANLMQVLVEGRQSELGSVPGATGTAGVAGILSTRAWAQAYFDMGTNRRATFYLLKNFMCSEMDFIMDTNLPDIYVARDVARAPGGDASEYKSYCVGCHAAQDAMRPAWAFYDYTPDNGGSITYTPGQVPQKLNRNANVFPEGYITSSDKFYNYWGGLPGVPNQHNERLGFKAPFEGNGAADLGKMVAQSKGFQNCMAYEAFVKMCYRNPTSGETEFIESVSSAFAQDGNMKEVYVKTAAHCVEDKYEEQ